MSRQQRRAADRAAAKQEFIDRIHPRVAAAVTIQQLWNLYFTERFEKVADRPFEPEHVELLRGVFYAGCASMFQLVTSLAGPDDEPDDLGAERLERLHEELNIYAKGLR